MARRAIEQENTEKKKNQPQVERRFWQPIRLLIVMAFLSAAAKNGADSMVAASNFNTLKNSLDRAISEIQFGDMNFPLSLLENPDTSLESLEEEIDLRDSNKFYQEFSQFMAYLDVYEKSHGQTGGQELSRSADKLVQRGYMFFSYRMTPEQLSASAGFINTVGAIRVKALTGESLPAATEVANLYNQFIENVDLMYPDLQQGSLISATRLHEAAKEASQTGKDAARNTLLFLGGAGLAVFVGRGRGTLTKETVEKKKNKAEGEPPKRKTSDDEVMHNASNQTLAPDDSDDLVELILQERARQGRQD